MSRLMCTLKEFVVTGEQDFIPAGTPVQVLAWDDTCEKVTVRVQAYLYIDAPQEDMWDGKFQGHINNGLHIDVEPRNLLFKDST